MSNQELHFALLRISAAQTLRAAGLTTTKPSVLDTFTDITARYLQLLALTTKNFAEMSNRPGSEVTVTDARAAMEHLGLIQPAPIFRRSRKRRKPNVSQDPNQAADLQGALDLINNPNSAYTNPGEFSFVGGEQGAAGNEGNNGDDDEYDDGEDTRGVDALIEWFKGPVAAEIRRVAGVMPGPGMPPTSTATAAAAAETGLGTANGSTQAPAAPRAPAVNTGLGTSSVAVAGTGISPEAAVETGPVTWLDGLKSKPDKWKGTALGLTLDDIAPVKIEGGPGPLGKEVPAT